MPHRGSRRVVHCSSSRAKSLDSYRNTWLKAVLWRVEVSGQGRHVPRTEEIWYSTGRFTATKITTCA